MSAQSPMTRLFAVGHAPHPIDRKRYGNPRLALFWASPRARFQRPGLYLWIGYGVARQPRILALPKPAEVSR